MLFTVYFELYNPRCYKSTYRSSSYNSSLLFSHYTRFSIETIFEIRPSLLRIYHTNGDIEYILSHRSVCTFLMQLRKCLRDSRGRTPAILMSGECLGTLFQVNALLTTTSKRMGELAPLLKDTIIMTEPKSEPTLVVSMFWSYSVGCIHAEEISDIRFHASRRIYNI